MTQQEAEIIVARLTRVWAPQRGFWVSRGLSLVFAAPLRDDIHIEYSVYSPTKLFPEPSSCYWLKEGEKQNSFMACYVPATSDTICYINVNFEDGSGKQGRYHALQNQCLDFFRRGGWLSGVFLEASAHEKAEWMQDYTREEIEAWKLKI